MEWETLKIEGEGAIRHLVLNRPRIHNAVNAQVLRDIVGACAHLDGLSGCRVVILRGEGPSFCSGADLREGLAGDAALRDLVSRARLGQRAIAALAGLVPVSIAAVHGHVIGGGACFAVACDFRIGAENTKVCVRETKLGLSLSWHSIPGFVHLVGPSRAKEMIMFAETYQAGVMLDYGFFNEVVPEPELLEAALRLAEKVVAQPPLPVEMTKASINAVVRAMDQAVFHLDPYGLALTARSGDSAKARRTAAGEPAEDWEYE